jgi:hypothetical protein
MDATDAMPAMAAADVEVATGAAAAAETSERGHMTSISPLSEPTTTRHDTGS